MIPIEKIKYHPAIFDTGAAFSNLKFRNNIWVLEEMDLIEFADGYLRSIDNPILFDIGASIGDFSMLPIFNKSLKCYSFEPHPFLFRFLRTHVIVNDLIDNTYIFNYAICDRDADVDFWISKNGNRSGQSCILCEPDFTEGCKKTTVKGIKLDTIVDEIKPKKIDLLKIDVEGAEILVLNGGEQTLRQYKPAILIEKIEKNLNRFSVSEKDLDNKLKSLNYVLDKKIGANDELWKSQ